MCSAGRLALGTWLSPTGVTVSVLPPQGSAYRKHSHRTLVRRAPGCTLYPEVVLYELPSAPLLGWLGVSTPLAPSALWDLATREVLSNPCSNPCFISLLRGFPRGLMCGVGIRFLLTAGSIQGCGWKLEPPCSSQSHVMTAMVPGISTLGAARNQQHKSTQEPKRGWQCRPHTQRASREHNFAARPADRLHPRPLPLGSHRGLRISSLSLSSRLSDLSAHS